MFPGLYFARPVWNRAKSQSGLDFVVLNPDDENGYDTTHLVVWFKR